MKARKINEKALKTLIRAIAANASKKSGAKTKAKGKIKVAVRRQSADRQG